MNTELTQAKLACSIEGLEVRPTDDFIYMNNLARDPDIYPCISDDRSPARDSFKLDESMIYLGVFLAGKIVGFFFLIPQDNNQVFVHTILGKNARGRVAIEAGKIGCSWVFMHTAYSAITSWAFETKKNVILFALKVGFTIAGKHGRECQVNGVKINMIDLILTKERWIELCQPQQFQSQQQ